MLREELIVGRSGSVRQSTELAIGVAFRMLRTFLGPEWRPRRVCFAHDAPADRSVHERVFGRHVEFGHDFNGIVCARADLEVPNPDADPEVARLARQMLEADAASKAPDVITRVRELIVMLLGTGTCTIDRVAQHLGIDRRTIHRRLAREGETFSGLVDAVRRELAERYVKERHRSLAEVSSLLGFSAPSGFSRWYRQRFKAKPSERRMASRPSTLWLTSSPATPTPLPLRLGVRKPVRHLHRAQHVDGGCKVARAAAWFRSGGGPCRARDGIGPRAGASSAPGQ